MKILRDAQKFIRELIKSGAPLEESGLGEQSFDCYLVEPSGNNLWMIPCIKIFGTKPITYESHITSSAITIGKGSDLWKERDRTSSVYFGYGFRQLENKLSSEFNCKIEQQSQIKCKDPSSSAEFVRLLVELYNEMRREDSVTYRNE